jgi:anti-anti-sigma regulatory factor
VNWYADHPVALGIWYGRRLIITLRLHRSQDISMARVISNTLLVFRKPGRRAYCRCGFTLTEPAVSLTDVRDPFQCRPLGTRAEDGDPHRMPPLADSVAPVQHAAPRCRDNPTWRPVTEPATEQIDIAPVTPPATPSGAGKGCSNCGVVTTAPATSAASTDATRRESDPPSRLPTPSPIGLTPRPQESPVPSPTTRTQTPKIGPSITLRAGRPNRVEDDDLKIPLSDPSEGPDLERRRWRIDAGAVDLGRPPADDWIGEAPNCEPPLDYQLILGVLVLTPRTPRLDEGPELKAFNRELAALLEERRLSRRAVVHLCYVAFLSGTALAVLVAHSDRLAMVGGAMRLCHVVPTVQATIERYGFPIEVYPRVDDAVVTRWDRARCGVL